MPGENRSDPYGSHRFRVEIDSVVAAGFSEVRGLSTSVSARHQEPDDGAAPRRGSESLGPRPAWRDTVENVLPWIGHSNRGRGDVGEAVPRTTTDRDARTDEFTPGNVEPTTVKLRRGITHDRELWDWFDRWVDGTGRPKNLRVFLLDSAGRDVRGWECLRARPIRWDGPTLVATESAVATETFELAHEGIHVLDISD